MTGTSAVPLSCSGLQPADSQPPIEEDTRKKKNEKYETNSMAEPITGFFRLKLLNRYLRKSS